MKSPSTKQEIIDATNHVYQLVHDFILDLDTDAFLFVPQQKWSINLQLDHLIKSSQPVATALNLPKITFRAFGIPNRDSKSYDEVVAMYHAQLKEGAKATKKYIPEVSNTSKEELLALWLKIGNKLSERIDKQWSEDQLERYLLPHPILGKLTVREMLFFTIYHTLHHYKSIQDIISSYHLSANK